jgi:hypothetical protein
MQRLQAPYVNFHQQILLAINYAAPFYEKLGFKHAQGVQAMWIYDESDINTIND